MKAARAPRRALTLADVTILQPGITLEGEHSPNPMSGKEVAQLLAAAEELNLAPTGHQGMVLEGVAELLRVIGDAADPDRDCWRAGATSVWLIAALLDGIRVAMSADSGARYEITVKSRPPTPCAT